MARGYERERPSTGSVLEMICFRHFLYKARMSRAAALALTIVLLAGWLSY